jgi:hypothetical protein
MTAGYRWVVLNTIVGIGSALAPTGFGALVNVSSRSAGYAVCALAPVAAFSVLAPLAGDESDRVAARERRLAAQARRSCNASQNPLPMEAT